MRTIIVDDEPDALNSLKIIIKEYIPDIELVGAFMHPKKALEEIPKLMPELLFLDIHLPEINAFQLLEMLPERNFHIVFITAFDEYAIKAFKYNAIDYLLKPININEIVNAVKRIREKKNQLSISYEDKYRELLKTINHNNNHAHEKLILSTIEGIYYIDPDDILYVNADSNYSKIIFKNAKPLTVSKNLGELFADLPKDYFFRNHHSYLVNLKYVRKYSRSDGGSIEMINGDQIPLARRKKNEFHEKMKELGKNLF
jgi:two-component system LytT family response regulator